MTRETAEEFMNALRALEKNGDVDGIVGLFTDVCEVGNTAADRAFEGREGAREFWEIYRDAFGEVKSTFTNVFATEEGAALEWVTQGMDPRGAPIRYAGVSILEFDGDAVKRFHAYFDPHEVGRHKPEARAEASRR